jgi:hypothetical protein
MPYIEALKQAGAEVLANKRFGSYQGDWVVKLSYNGVNGWTIFGFGSCSGCDSYEARFSRVENHAHEDNKYFSPDCHIEEARNMSSKCQPCAVFLNELSDFGKEYLDDVMTQEEAEAKASENIEWDMEAGEMLAFIKGNTWNAAPKKASKLK